MTFTDYLLLELLIDLCRKRFIRSFDRSKIS